MNQGKHSRPRIVISGASGLIGRALCRSFLDDGYDVATLVRNVAPGAGDLTHLPWEPGKPLDPEVLRSAEAVICLNGAPISKLPWTREYRHTLYDSRVVSALTIARALEALGEEAPFFACASAVGYYGSSPSVALTEQSPAGDTYLARLCTVWERAAKTAGPHVALLRTAPVLHRAGMLAPMILLTKLGIAGPLGSGNQSWGWISLEDEVRAIRFVVDQKLTGPVNISGTERATANDVGKELAAQMNRPFWFPAPAFILKTVLGADPAESLLLTDAHVHPEKLIQAGFEFRHRRVADAVAAGLAG
ncbi:MAG: TIGR01777 family oxidoreductase [Ancrocorticia sp.]|uniref:TIGR01777 family oxidoreductase n=1 Tax=Ancrocorticia sp. TaxID=2593684 RepID=UPI003F8F44FC